MPGSKDEIVITLIAGSLLFLFLCLVIFLFIHAYQRRQINHRLEKQQLQSQFQQTLLQSQLEIQEQTFKNISQEIHDNIGQALTLAKLNLNTMPVTTEQQEKVTMTKEIISKAISDLRDLGRSLNTDYITDAGLLHALEYELTLISKSAAIRTSLHSSGTAFRMDKQKELILFRMVQESLNNILKHAGAHAIQVSINYAVGILELSIVDDGKGFEMADVQPENSSGLGLRNMHNRAKLIGATLSIHSTPHSSTTVHISVANTDSDYRNQT